MIVGSILALLAFLLAVTMSMASDRFDTRRGIVLDEANSIGTTYLRAGYLPEPASSQIRQLLREYVPLRIVVTDAKAADLAGGHRAFHGDPHPGLGDLARRWPKRRIRATSSRSYLDSLNETIDLNETRVTAGLYARVPETILLLLIVGSVLGIGMVGYSAGLTERRSLISAVVLAIALGAVIMILVDLDRPREGFIQVSQQPLIDLQRQIGPP